MSCSWTNMCPPRTDLDKQTNKQRKQTTKQTKCKGERDCKGCTVYYRLQVHIQHFFAEFILKYDKKMLDNGLCKNEMKIFH